MRQHTGYIKENPDGADPSLIIYVGTFSKVRTLKYKKVFWKTNFETIRGMKMKGGFIFPRAMV